MLSSTPGTSHLFATTMRGRQGKFVGIKGQLTIDDAVILHRIATLVAARHVHDMENEGRALDMAKELMTQTATLMGAFDQAGDIRHDEVVFVAFDHAQVGDQRGEGIIRNLGTSGTHTRDKGALARRRHADQSRVRHELHFKLDPAILCRLAKLGESGGTTRRGDEVDVAATSDAAVGHGDALAVVRQVGDDVSRFLRIFEILAHDRSHGHLEDKVLAAGAVHAASFAVRAARCALK